MWLPHASQSAIHSVGVLQLGNFHLSLSHTRRSSCRASRIYAHTHRQHIENPALIPYLLSQQFATRSYLLPAFRSNNTPSEPATENCGAVVISQPRPIDSCVTPRRALGTLTTHSQPIPQDRNDEEDHISLSYASPGYARKRPIAGYHKLPALESSAA